LCGYDSYVHFNREEVCVNIWGLGSDSFESNAKLEQLVHFLPDPKSSGSSWRRSDLTLVSTFTS